MTSTSVSRRAPEQASASVADLLPMVAKQHATSGIYCLSGEQAAAEYSSYPDLLEEAQRILGGLKACAGPQGANVALLLEHPRDFIPALWASMLGGYVPCPLSPIVNDPERWAKHIAHVDALLDHPLFVTTAELGRYLPATVASAALQDLRTATPDESVCQRESSDPAILVLTSGSTGNSKAVVLTHGNLLASMAGKTQCQKLTSADITLNWISFDHVAALLEAHLFPLYVGATQLHVLSAPILNDPLLFLRIIDRFRVSMTFSPNFLFGQINAALSRIHEDPARQQPALDLSCLRHIISGGEAIVVETGRQFLDLLAPHGLRRDALWPAFGMTETCAGSVYSREFPDGESGREFAFLGLPVDRLQMRVADDHGVALLEGQTGELQLRGPMIFTHYHNNKEATSAAFTADGWFRTGDVGYLSDGRLSLVGRNKDSIIVNGVNYFSHELEVALGQLSGVESSFVAAFPTRPKGADTEQLVVVFATTLSVSDEDGLYQVIAAIRNTTIMMWGFRPAVILPLSKEAFPKTSLGKIQRALLRRRFEAGEFGAQAVQVARTMSKHLGAYTPPEGRLESVLTEVFAQILGVDAATLSATANFFDLGGTSLDTLKLTQAIEQRFEQKASLPVVLQNPTVRRLAGRMASGSSPATREYDPIVPLQTTGKKTPLFFIHPGNGEILIYVNLAKYFVNERPFYALRARGFNKGDECFGSFDELLETYLRAILERQPRGPYLLAGYSLGAGIAFEIAKRIESRGDRVAFLGCVDEPARDREPQRDLISIATGLAALLHLIDLPQMERLDAQLRGEQSASEPCEYVFRHLSPERMAELDLDLSRFTAWVQVSLAVANMMLPRGTFGTVKTMSVFQSVGNPSLGVPPREWQDRLRCWDRFVLGPRYLDVPGEHLELMLPKHVAAFQEILRAEIDRAEAHP